MLGSGTKKTKLGRRIRSTLGVLPLAIIVCSFLAAITVVHVIQERQAKDGCLLSIRYPAAANLEQSYAGECITLETVSTPDLRRQGLSGRNAMPITEGMLFVFEEPNSLCFWMKDMSFGLDMIWLDASKEVIQINRSVPPDTYPERFCSSSPAQYVIELNEGLANVADIAVGDYIDL